MMLEQSLSYTYTSQKMICSAVKTGRGPVNFRLPGAITRQVSAAACETFFASSACELGRLASAAAVWL
jgi:hypothetical protein